MSTAAQDGAQATEGPMLSPEQIEIGSANEMFGLLAFVIAPVTLAIWALVVSPASLAWFRSSRRKSSKGLAKAAVSSIQPFPTRDEAPQAGAIRGGFKDDMYPGSLSPPMQRAILPASSTMTTFRCVYNSGLLPMIPKLPYTIGQALLLMVYTGIVIFAVLPVRFGFTQNVNRYGTVAVAQLPLITVLAGKGTGPLALIGKGWEKVNFLHRYAGGVFFVLGAIHGALHIVDAINGPEGFSLQRQMLTGTVILTSITLMFVTGLSFVRSRIYETFMVIHVIGWISILGALLFHATPLLTTYLLPSILPLVMEYLIRLPTSHCQVANFRTMPGGLTRIEIEKLGDGWRAGQHVLIRVMNGFSKFQKHPFTIANAPQADSPYGSNNSMVLVVKAAGDFTTKLRNIDAEVKTYNDPEKQAPIVGAESRIPVVVEGAYGGPKFIDFREHESTVLFGGGSGFSYVMANLEDLVGNVRTGKGVTRHILVIWTLRDLGMLSAYTDQLHETLSIASSLQLDVSIRIHHTGPTRSSLAQLPEMRGVKVYGQRVDVRQVVEEVVELSLGDVHGRGAVRGCGVGVGVCGPVGLVRSVRGAVGAVNWGKAKEVGGLVVHSEMF